MDAQVLKNILEAALLAAGRPLKIEQLLELFEEPARPSRAEVRQVLSTLQEEYEHRGIRLTEVANGFRVQVGPDMTEQLSRLWQERPPRYSRATLETLALIAYRQPITRGEIEEVRGVSVSSNIMRNLLERNWIRIVGHRDVPGRPGLYATTRDFLDYFGLKSLDELPPLTELKDFDNLTVEMDLSAPEEPRHLRAVPDQEEESAEEPQSVADDMEEDDEDDVSASGEVETLQAATGDTMPVKCLTDDQARMSPEAFESSARRSASEEETEPETLASKGLS